MTIESPPWGVIADLCKVTSNKELSKFPRNQDFYDISNDVWRRRLILVTNSLNHCLQSEKNNSLEIMKICIDTISIISMIYAKHHYHHFSKQK